MKLFLQIAQMPSLGKQRDFSNPLLKEIRMWFVKGFEKHLVIYRQTENGIEIVRLLHSARDIESILSEEEP
jgi:toxin ParE1/3/4